MRYHLPNGNTVETFQTDTGTEFVTRNADGNVISNIRPTPGHAENLINLLEANAQ